MPKSGKGPVLALGIPKRSSFGPGHHQKVKKMPRKKLLTLLDRGGEPKSPILAPKKIVDTSRLGWGSTTTSLALGISKKYKSGPGNPNKNTSLALGIPKKYKFGSGNPKQVKEWPRQKMLTLLGRGGSEKYAQKKVKLWRKWVHIKDIGKSSSEKLREVFSYLFYNRHPQKTALKIKFYTKIQKSKNPDF